MHISYHSLLTRDTAPVKGGCRCKDLIGLFQNLIVRCNHICTPYIPLDWDFPLQQKYHFAKIYMATAMQKPVEIPSIKAACLMLSPKEVPERPSCAALL